MKQQLKALLKSGMRILFRSTFGRAAIGYLIAGYVRLVLITSRVERYEAPEAIEYLNGEKVAIFTFWHGRMLLMPSFHPQTRKIRALISIHRDGEWIAGAMARFGVGLVRGSSRRGGHAALREALNVLQSEENLVITPDGPRGPAEIAQQGAAALASLTGVGILPASVATTRGFRIRSWDRFLIPLPFSRVVFVALPPLQVPAEGGETTIDKASEALTDALRRADRFADALVAGEAVEHPPLANSTRI